MFRVSMAFYWLQLVGLLAMASPFSYSKDFPFIAEMYNNITEELNPDRIGSSEKYSLLLHLVRTPVKFSKDLQIEADLLDSWKVEDSSRKFTLVFKMDSKFSNGEPITAKNFKEIIDWQILKKSSIHFNFARIKSVRLLDNYKIEIQMHESVPNFIRHLIHPEFGIYYKYPNRWILGEYRISSGPFFVSTNNSGSILLQKNTNYPSSINYPAWVSWRASGLEKQVEGLREKVVDFAVPHQGFGFAHHKEVLKNKSLKSFDPNVGYTFFISLNPNSSIFNSIEKRVSFLKLLSKIEIDFSELSPVWEKANQLYLKGGLGRPSADEISSVWRGIHDVKPKPNPKKIRLLMASTFNFSTELLKFLESKKIQVELTKYKNFDEYADFLKKEKFDLIQANNDFSSVELLENLLVTFRESRPLIYSTENIKKLMRAAESSELIEEKSANIKEIDLELIKNGLVFPIAHYKKFVYLKKSISTTNISSLFPDIRIYKLQVDVSDGN